MQKKVFLNLQQNLCMSKNKCTFIKYILQIKKNCIFKIVQYTKGKLNVSCCLNC